jgi:hypothetical protein
MMNNITNVAKKVGFWRLSADTVDCQLPYPVANNSLYQNNEFLKKLKMIEWQFNQWSEIEWMYWSQSVEHGILPGFMTSYCGDSQCRLCGAVNGCSEYNLKFCDTTYTWPSGLYHYYTDHSVEPDNEFVQFIMCIDISQLNIIPWTKDELDARKKILFESNVTRVLYGMSGLQYSE